MADCLIVGGGILGMLTARELMQSGNKVTLIDQNELGRESSWAGGGIISPLYPWRYPESISLLAKWSQTHYPELCNSLKQSSDIDPEHINSGMLIAQAEDRQAAETWASQFQIDLSLISSAEVANLEPQLAAPKDHTLWMPAVCQVRNPRFVQALAADIIGRGVTIRTQQSVTGLLSTKNRIIGLKTSNGALYADNVVICAGAWTTQLLKPHTPEPDIRPIRGQMLLFNAKPGLIKRIVLEGNRYIIPRKDGRVLFGSTMEDVGFTKKTTQEARDELYNIATERFPVLKEYPIEKHWAGLRPGSPTGIPYICSHPELAGLYINAGHFRNGVVLGPASARLCADLVTGREPSLPAAPYRLNAPRE